MYTFLLDLVKQGVLTLVSEIWCCRNDHDHCSVFPFNPMKTKGSVMLFYLVTSAMVYQWLMSSYMLHTHTCTLIKSEQQLAKK